LFLKFWHHTLERDLVTPNTIIMSLYVVKCCADYQMMVVIFKFNICLTVHH